MCFNKFSYSETSSPSLTHMNVDATPSLTPKVLPTPTQNHIHWLRNNFFCATGLRRSGFPFMEVCSYLHCGALFISDCVPSDICFTLQAHTHRYRHKHSHFSAGLIMFLCHVGWSAYHHHVDDVPMLKRVCAGVFVCAVGNTVRIVHTVFFFLQMMVIIYVCFPQGWLKSAVN